MTTKKVRGATMVAIDEISLSGDNMREDVGDLDELAWSIRKHGILQPLLLTERKGVNLLVCGHRRLAAARRAGLDEVPVVFQDLTEDERLELMLVENVHRKYLSPLEEAHAFKKMMGKLDLTQIDIASRVGKSQMYVSTRISLLSLPEDVQQKVHKGELSLYKAVGQTRTPNARTTGEKLRDGLERWYIYYIDRLVGWLEAGRIDIEDDVIFGKLELLSRTLKALPDRAPKFQKQHVHEGRSDGDYRDDDPDIVAKVPMCNWCGTVVDVSRCCGPHGDLCTSCKARGHKAA